jgi:large subunit ribosomal protein L9
MRVILKQDVDKLGRKGDVVNVAVGFGRNFLIPKKLAVEVTDSNVKMIEIERAALKKKVEVERKSFQGLVEKLNQTSLTFARRAGEKDVIFGSVSSGDIRDELAKLGLEVDKKKILLDEPIKRLGNFTVPIKIYHDDRAAVKVVIVKEAVEGEEKSSGPAAGAGTDTDKE